MVRARVNFWAKLAGASLPLIFSACAHQGPTPDKTVESNSVGDVSGAQIREAEAPSETVEQNVEKPYYSPMGEIALDDNKHVQQWIHYFQGKGRKYMTLYLARSTTYLPMMKNVLRENGLPEDLVYISLIESGFSPQAHSNANAIGYWQFIRSTGRHYGLHVDGFIDERRDPVLSTRAAAEFFKELYSLFGSWHLALAAYNTGENRVKRAVMKSYTRDFWELIKKRRALPAETKQYVPKFIAAAMIAKDPVKYGFTGIEFTDPLSYDTVALTNPISLTKLAQNLNVDVDELKLLNPKFRGDFVPISRGGETVVRIPVGKGTDAVAAVSLSTSKEPKVVQADDYFYRVHSGDNLSMIAKRHHTTVSRLRRMNNLSNRTLLRVGMHLRVPDAGGEGYHYVTESATSRNGASVEPAVATIQTPQGDYHVVRRGENITTISRRFGISIDDLLKINNLTKSAVIRAGQKIRVRVDSSQRSASRGTNVSRVSATMPKRKIAAVGVRHKIAKGETLTGIAVKYKVSLMKLAQANNIKPGNKVLVGQNLIIPRDRVAATSN